MFVCLSWNSNSNLYVPAVDCTFSPNLDDDDADDVSDDVTSEKVLAWSSNVAETVPMFSDLLIQN